MRKRMFTGALIGAIAMMGITGYAQVYTDSSIIMQVQERLNEAGFACGTADGIAGSQTAEAIRAYQAANALTASGEIDDELLESMGISASAESSKETEENQEESETEGAPTDGQLPSYTPGEENIVYDLNDVTVTAIPYYWKSPDTWDVWKYIQYQVENHSENPVVMTVMGLAVNDITIEKFVGDQSWIMRHFEDEVDYFAPESSVLSPAEEFNNYSDSFCYVGAGETGQKYIIISYGSVDDYGMKDVFGYERVEKLETAVTVSGLKEELAFDGTDTVTELYTDGGIMTESQIPDSGWDDTWTDAGGTVVYEDENIRLLELGIKRAMYDFVEIGMVIENKSDQPLTLSAKGSMEASLDGIMNGMLNGQEAEAFCFLQVLPGTRTYSELRISREEEELSGAGDVESASCTLEVEDDSFEVLQTIDYVYGEAIG